jgi:hypothetical protein
MKNIESRQMKKDNSKKDKIHANFLISDRIKEIEKML